MQFTGKTAVVTGAAGGIGREIVKRFVAEGARVLAVDLDGEAASSLAASLAGESKSVLPLAADVSLEEGGARIRQAVEARLGHADILVNNAGIYPPRPFDKMTYAEWRQVMAVNLDSAFLVTQSVLPLMRAGSRIVNVSSGTIWLGYRGVVHYAASKAGLIGFTRALAAELGDAGIAVNAVTPGLTATARALETFSAESFALRRAQRAIKRDQKAEDVVGAVLFLSSADAEFMTGQTVNVDGGLALH